jgi:Holliday junction resolvase-like predicted endonuclease
MLEGNMQGRVPHAPGAAGGPWARVAAVRRALGTVAHSLRADGAGVAFALLVHRLRLAFPRVARDPGERTAERFLRALGMRVIARNWRSARDRRDEADLLALSPDGALLLLVEVKRASGPWDALERVDARKREVLWRLFCDLEECVRRARAGCPARGDPPRLAGVRRIRVDLVGIEGTARRAMVSRQVVALFEREIARRDHQGKS